MAATDNFSDAAALGRSSSMDARDGLSRSDSQRKTKGGRRGPRSGNELFVCFAPRTSLNLVSRPVLSPAREKGKEHPGSGRRGGKALSSSIFSKAAVKKQGFEGEEPTSPKVTCIGQVRVKHKKGKEAAALLKGGKQQRSLKSSVETVQEAKPHKESACSSFGKDFSCFGLPCDSYGSLPSFRGDKKSGGAVFAKSLVLIQQETEGKPESKGAAIGPATATATANIKQSENREPACPSALDMEKAVRDSEQVAAVVPETSTGKEAPAATQLAELEKSLIKQPEDPVSETEMEEYDSFEPEPPPPNALLLMRHKGEHLRVAVPPPSTNITLKRSTSAPVQCRSKEEEDRESEVVLEQKDEDTPKLTSSTKSFLKRCKSVSQSLTRSNSTQGSAHSTEAKKDNLTEEEAVPSEAPAPQAIDAPMEKEPPPHELNLINVGRSESESLKISLDFVPETWLWETCTIVRHPKSDKRIVDKQGAEWLDAELEASLWKSCKISEPPQVKDTGTASNTTEQVIADAGGAEWLDAEVEATLWRSCRVATSAQQSLQEDVDVPETEQDLETKHNVADGMQVIEEQRTRLASLGRSCSVGNQGGRQLESGCSLCRSASVGSQGGRSIGHSGIGLKDTKDKCTGIEEGKSVHLPHAELSETNLAKIEIERIPDQGENFTVCIVKNGEDPIGPVKNCSCDENNSKQVFLEEGNIPDQEAMQLPHNAVKNAETKEPLCQAPFSALLDPTPAPAPAPSPSPSPGSETLLFLRYNLGAFHISLDASEGIIDKAEQQQKARMLKAVSHLHEVGTYARLLKASSGKERVSLSSAFRLQRCKSEPVRLTSY